MKIKKRLQIAGLVLSIVFISSCSSRTQYLNAVYNQDLTKNEFSSAKNMTYDNNSGILYRISNDDKFLVINLQVGNQITQKKILLFGMTVWFDESGKKKKYKGVKYPIGNTRKRMSAKRMKESQGNFNHNKQQFISDLYEVGIIGQNGTKDMVITDIRYKTGTEAKISFDSYGMMYYRLKIPYKKLNIKYEELKYLNPSIGFVTGHVEMKQGAGGGMKPGGMRGGGMSGGGRPGGGMGQGGRGGAGGRSNPEMQAMMSETSFWVKNLKFANTVNE